MIRKLLLALGLIALLTVPAQAVPPTGLSFEWEAYIVTEPECLDCTIEFFIDSSTEGSVATLSNTEVEHTVPFIDDGESHNYWIRAYRPSDDVWSGNSTVVTIDPWVEPPVDPEPPITPPGPPGSPAGMTYRLIFENVVIQPME